MVGKQPLERGTEPCGIGLVGAGGGHDVPDEALVAGTVLAQDDGGVGDTGLARSAASVSPGSIRSPRSLICWSMRPRCWRAPSGRRRARSPVR